MSNWLRSLPSGNSLPVSPISPYVSSCLTHCFPSFLGYFPCFPWCFSLLSILGLTVNVLAKTWFVATNLQQKCSTFGPIFPLYKIFLQTHASRMPSLTFSANMILLTKAKQVFKLIKDNYRYYSFSYDFPMRHVNGCLEIKILSLKYPHLQLLI